jgi:Domain of unknown function (DUF4157)
VQTRLKHHAGQDTGTTSAALREPARPVAAAGLDRLALPGLSRGGRPATIRRRARADDPLGGSVVDADTQRRLAGSAGGGRALDPGVRGSMEAAFGADFQGVNIHTDANAAQLARQVQATAFTHGNNIYFSPGTFDPASARGQHLLAHELTHVVQQQNGRGGGGRSAAGPVIGPADDPAELEAEGTARDVVGSLRRQATQLAALDQPAHHGGEAGG